MFEVNFKMNNGNPVKDSLQALHQGMEGKLLADQGNPSISLIGYHSKVSSPRYNGFHHHDPLQDFLWGEIYTSVQGNHPSGIISISVSFS